MRDYTSEEINSLSTAISQEKNLSMSWQRNSSMTYAQINYPATVISKDLQVSVIPTGSTHQFILRFDQKLKLESQGWGGEGEVCVGGSPFTERHHLSSSEAHMCGYVSASCTRLPTPAAAIMHFSKPKIESLWLSPGNLWPLWENFWTPGQPPEIFLSICLGGDTFWA